LPYPSFLPFAPFLLQPWFLTAHINPISNTIAFSASRLATRLFFATDLGLFLKPLFQEGLYSPIRGTLVRVRDGFPLFSLDHLCSDGFSQFQMQLSLFICNPSWKNCRSMQLICAICKFAINF
jgi:hypothetical protein